MAQKLLVLDLKPMIFKSNTFPKKSLKSLWSLLTTKLSFTNFLLKNKLLLKDIDFTKRACHYGLELRIVFNTMFLPYPRIRKQDAKAGFFYFPFQDNNDSEETKD